MGSKNSQPLQKQTIQIKMNHLFPNENFKNAGYAQNFKKGSCVLDLSKCLFIQGKLLFAEPKDAGFPFSQAINSHLASLSMVRNTGPTPDPTVREALCATDNLNASIESEGQIKMYINEVCQETVSRCSNSFLQQAGLNLLISMTVINNMLAKSVSDLKFPLISEGSGYAKVQVLKPLMGLSEKPVLAGELVGAQMLFSFMSLFIRKGNREILPETPAP
ncbi:protein ARMCX6-like [Chlorocebus sabaeus]|uniref:protein ARMCX6-like n=1 Tax=Chlorocebus sabaeus TaxID=60711 RepID=UPI00045DB901|nr:protein ARMCX6-like [Chlorocebus sabaeus]